LRWYKGDIIGRNLNTTWLSRLQKTGVTLINSKHVNGLYYLYLSSDMIGSDLEAAKDK